jgi:hypothetical protein
MIDRSISSALAALGAESRLGLLALDDTLARLAPAAAAPARPRRRFVPSFAHLVRAVAVVAGAAAMPSLFADSQTAPTVALAVVMTFVLAGMISSGETVLASRLAVRRAAAIGMIACVGYVTWSLVHGYAHHRELCTYVDPHGVVVGPCSTGDAYGGEAVTIVVGWLAIAAIARGLASVFARSWRVSRLDGWSAAATITALLALVVGITFGAGYEDRFSPLIDFRPAFRNVVEYGLLQIHNAMGNVLIGPRHFATELSTTQLCVLVAGGLGLVLAATVGVACARERRRPSAGAWLAILEHPATILLSTIIAMALSLRVAWLDMDETPLENALAVLAALVASAGAVLRRRRRDLAALRD